jgi:hypothetical protein
MKPNTFQEITEAWAKDPKRYFWFQRIHDEKIIKHQLLEVRNEVETQIYYAYNGVAFHKVYLQDPTTKKPSPHDYIGQRGAFWDSEKEQWVPGILERIVKGNRCPFKRSGGIVYCHFRPADNLPLDYTKWPADGIEFSKEDLEDE